MITTNATDFGPLQILIGSWHGQMGTDIAPDPDGTETNRFRERLTFNPVRPFSNAEEQNLFSVQYHQVIYRINDNKQIHDQCGYWSWDAQTDTLIHSFSIPRGLSVVAGGQVKKDEKARFTYQVAASADSDQWCISQSPFLAKKAKTLKFEQIMTVAGSELNYQQSVLVDIYGRQFEHTDESTLIRVT